MADLRGRPIFSSQVFISYAANDRNAADMIASALEAKNIRFWIAPRDIRPGDEWPDKIPDAVEKSSLVVLVFSANANKSKWVMREINHALDENKTIIPFRIENVSPQGTLKLLKSNIQWLDASKPPLEGHIKKLAAIVQQHLGITPSPPHLHPQPQDFPANPFSEIRPIQKPARFIGREAEMRRLKTMLQGGSVALLGEPRIGKSSLMLHLVRNWDSDIKVIGPLDCMSLEDRDDFYEQIAEALALDNSNWRSIRRSLNSNRMLLLVDELDIGPGKGLTYADIGNFRAVCHSNQDFKMVAVSRTPINNVFPYPGVGSQAYDFLVTYTLGLLTDAEARRLLNHPWESAAPLFETETCERLLELAGCHPYKLQRAACHYFEFLADPTYDWHSGYQQDREQMR